MANKRCSDCGQFMKLEDLLPIDDEFDEELALLCGYSEEQINNRFYLPESVERELTRFNFIQDTWVCSGCGNEENHDDGPKYYYNPDTNNYDAPAPLTDAQRAALENQRQEAAGQLRLEI